VLVFVEPIELVYSGLTTKIGSPKEVQNDQHSYSDLQKVPPHHLKIPESVIRLHIEAESHEITFQDGSFSTLNSLYPYMRG